MTVASTQKILKFARNGIDWDSVMDYLIQNQPDIVADAVEKTSEGSWTQEVRDFAQNNNKVPVIRFMRELTGCGIKEAKDWVETNCPKFYR